MIDCTKMKTFKLIVAGEAFSVVIQFKQSQQSYLITKAKKMMVQHTPLTQCLHFSHLTICPSFWIHQK